jgi:L-arabinonolactonase
MRIERLGDITCSLGEGPVWDEQEQALYFVDILGRKIHRYDYASQKFDSWTTQSTVGSLALRQHGGALVAFGDGFGFFDFKSGDVTPLGNPAADIPGAAWSDGKVDPRGRFLAGTISLDLKGMIGGLYSVEHGRIFEVATGFGITNGPCWSPDGKTFYYADCIPREIYAYDYDLETGTVSNRRVFANTHALGGIPDGATVDAAGRLWSAICEAGKIACWRPDGTLERIIPMPTKNVSSVMFGGPNLDRMFVTSIDGPCIGFEADAAGGQLFVIDGLGVTGRPEPRYRG